MLIAIMAGIGWIFVICSIIGMAVPGWNFHAVIAEDIVALKWHQDHAELLKKKIELSSRKESK